MSNKNNDYNVLVGGRIRQWRKKAGLTQVDLQERTGIDQGVISSWETGKSAPGSENLAKLQAAFPWINLVWVISGKLAEEEWEKLSETDLEILSQIKRVRNQSAHSGGFSVEETAILLEVVRIMESGEEDAMLLTKLAIRAAAEIIEKRGRGKKARRKRN